MLGARAEVLELAETLGAPMVKPLLGKAVVPDDSPYTTGGIGLLGTAPSQDAMEECDTLLMAGTSFPYMEFYPKPGKAEPSRSTSTRPASACATRWKSAWWATARRVLALLPLLHRRRTAASSKRRRSG